MNISLPFAEYGVTVISHDVILAVINLYQAQTNGAGPR